MSATLLVAALLAQSAPLVVEGSTARSQGEDWIDVGYAELAAGRPAEAIARISANDELEAGDPAALINLGSAHARLGHRAKAEGYYRSAIISGIRYDVELADGRWMDTRRAARLALQNLGNGQVLALR